MISAKGITLLSMGAGAKSQGLFLPLHYLLHSAPYYHIYQLDLTSLFYTPLPCDPVYFKYD